MHTSDNPQPENVAATAESTAPGPQQAEGAAAAPKAAAPEQKPAWTEDGRFGPLDEDAQGFLRLYRGLGPGMKPFFRRFMGVLSQITAEENQGVVDWSAYYDFDTKQFTPPLFDRLEAACPPEDRYYIAALREMSQQEGGAGNA